MRKRLLQPAEVPDKATVVGRALLRAAEFLGLSAKDLSLVVGVSEATLSRLKRKQEGGLSGKPYELALLFIRLYRSLDAITGGDDNASKRWMHAENTALGGKPLNRIKTVEGLAHVLAYLDARRAPV
jgi:transcriptional regulator with XRE-family HTH domain